MIKRKPASEPYTLEWLMRWTIPEPNSGCWLWTGTLNPGGYGCVGFQGKTKGAHRVAYMLANGSISAGMDLDHLCRVRCYVNPGHLEAVTRSVNLRRGEAGQNLVSKALAKTHCQPATLTKATTYMSISAAVERASRAKDRTCANGAPVIATSPAKA